MANNDWDPRAQAQDFEQRTKAHVGSIEIPSASQLIHQVRWYLQNMTNKGRTKSGVHMLKQKVNQYGDTQIEAGPTFHKQGAKDCVVFQSGAELSFGITIHEEDRKSSLLAYRFHLELLPQSGLDFVRIDLNMPNDNYDPLDQPRSHMHPGVEGMHFPFPPMHPIAVLDRIFHVIEPGLTP